MSGDLTVVGLDPLRVRGAPLGQLTIEEMARYCAREVPRRQPAGLYLLGGWCAGGAIAFELAAQIERAGRNRQGGVRA